MGEEKEKKDDTGEGKGDKTKSKGRHPMGPTTMTNPLVGVDARATSEVKAFSR